MHSKISKLLSRLYILLVLFQVSYLAAAEEVLFEPMGKKGAPLGTVWVKELDPSLKTYHLPMVQKELADSNPAGIQTNIAMFALSIKTKDGRLIPIVDRTSKTFLSGGTMLVSPETEELEDIPAKRKRNEDDLGKKEKKLRDKRSELTKFAGIAGSGESDVAEAGSEFVSLLRVIRQCEADVDQAKTLIATLKQEENKYFSPKFRDNPRYKEHTNAIYDPEQTIARIVDYHISQAVVNAGDLTITGQKFERIEVDSIVLNLHTRTDMCPFCSMFLAHKLQEWQKKMVGVPVIALVTSRQEYRCGYLFMTEQPYYQGFSMRSFARRPGDDGSSFDGLKQIAAEGLVVQYAFPPEEVYPNS